MHRGGHREITVDLHGVELTERAALDLLRGLAEELRARDGRLVVLTEEEEPS